MASAPQLRFTCFVVFWLILLASAAEDDRDVKRKTTRPPGTGPIKWSKCRIIGTMIDTVDGHSLNCFGACNVTVLRNFDRKLEVKILRHCGKTACSRMVRITVGHPTFRGIKYCIILYPDLSIKLISGRRVRTYTAERALLILARYPFAARYGGDTLTFEIRCLGILLIWDIYQDLTILFNPSVTGAIVGVCYFAGGMGPHCSSPGLRARTPDEHIRSWISGICIPLKCSKENELNAWRICELVRDEPFCKCKQVMDTCDYPARCKDAVCTCLECGGSEAKCKCEALTKFVKECLLVNSKLVTLLQDGLNNHHCVPKCPPGKKYVYCCKQVCQKTCVTRGIEDCSELKDVCVSGCRCPNDLVDKAGICIPPIKCRDCVCAGSTDGTFNTFDEQHFKFQSSCTYVLCRDTNNGLELLVKYTPCKTSKAKYSSVLITFNSICGKRYELQKSINFLGQTIVTVNSRRVPLPYKDCTIHIDPIIGGVQLVVTDLQLMVTLTSDAGNPDVFHYKVRIPSILYNVNINPTEGLCGICCGKGSKKDILRLWTRNRTITNDVSTYIHSWLMASISPDYAHENREGRCQGHGFSPCDVIDRQEEKICRTIFRLKCNVFKDCLEEPFAYYHECKELICMEENLSDKKALACRIWREYASKCCEQRHELGDWRSLAGCPPINCRSPMCYRPCGHGCQATCVHPKCPSSVEWKEGCYCPTGMVHATQGCIPTSQCNICFGHMIGDTWKNFQSCEECTCEASQRVVCEKMCPGPPPKCSWDRELRGTKESGSCCSRCECKKPCPPPRQVRKCIKGEIVRVSITSCGCELRCCFCDHSLCKPKPVCSQYQTLYTYKLEDDCCEYHKCECTGASCCPTLDKPRCTDEQMVVEIYDIAKCCVISYKCKCQECPMRPIKPICRHDQVLCAVTTRCNCKKYICKCKKCPPCPICGKYAKLQKYHERGRCCPTYVCKCIPGCCPNIRPPIRLCQGDEILTSVFDLNKCCVVRYRCKCRKVCKPPSRPACHGDQILAPAVSRCKCKIFHCVCNPAACTQKPKCTQYQMLKDITGSALRKPCCRKYTCECVPLFKCPVIPVLRCDGEKVPSDITDPDGCCTIRRECACPDDCPIKPVPKCKRGEKLELRVSPCDCRYKVCVCDVEKCPVVVCHEYEMLIVVKTNDCCDKKVCRCDDKKCKDIAKDPSKCTREEKLVPVFDPSKCCIIKYKCECQDCPDTQPKHCRPFEKLVKQLSKCGCPHYSCKCDQKKCKDPPTCGKFCVLVSYYQNAGDCCHKYKCICDLRRCPQLDAEAAKCPPGKTPKPILDPTKCCIIAYKCVCKPCKHPPPKICQPGEKQKVEKDDCGCLHPICLCNGTTVCPKKPICSKYQVLKVKMDTKDCCIVYVCVCIGLSHCPPIKHHPPCGRDEVMTDVYDPDDCCITRKKCTCDKCKPSPRPHCGPYHRVVNNPTRCCNHYRCVCDSSKCPEKQCPPHHKLNEYQVKGKCCPKQLCECVTHKCPDPSVSKPTCKDEQEHDVEYDAYGCCTHYVCKCPKNACKTYNLSCGPYEKVVMRTTICKCTISHCECDHTKCPKSPKCGKYQKLVKTEQQGKCCIKFLCVCDSDACPDIRPNSRRCTPEEWLKSVTDPDKCCIIAYKCVCCPCQNVPAPICKKYQKILIKKTKCGCIIKKCVCDDSIACRPVPGCNKYQELVETKSSNPCCRIYKCVCRPPSCCPKIRTPRCKDEQKVVEIIDSGNCCVIKKICKCPPKCPYCPKPRCKVAERRITIKTKCCIRYICRCDKLLCPKIICGKYQIRVVIPIRGKCCDRIECQCAIRKCPLPIIKRKCIGDKVLIPVRDKCSCCILKYICICRPCPTFKRPKCRKYKKVVNVKTLCGCWRPKCVCCLSKCPKAKICGKYEKLQKRRIRGRCCAKYKCVCNRLLCPDIKPDVSKCKDEEKLKPVYDDDYCCVIKWQCKCQSCTTHPKPTCRRGNTITFIKSKCGCPVPICVCSGIECPPCPVCGKYEKLVKTHSFSLTSCCPQYQCVCIPFNECPVIPVPQCEDEEVLKEEVGECCIESRRCVCPEECPEKSSESISCGKYHRLVNKPTKCCMEFVCECDISQCPVLQCPPCHELLQTNHPHHCCPRQKCVCKPALCPVQKPEDIICRGDQILMPVMDSKGCCITYKCQCEGCPDPVPCHCSPTEKVVEKRSLCNCPIYICVCDEDKCRGPPICGRHTKLKKVHETGDCCPTYTCECKHGLGKWRRCRRNIQMPLCKDEQVMMPFYNRLECCIEKWACVCLKCPHRPKLTCRKGEKLIVVKTCCNCIKYLCVCHHPQGCDNKPDCSPYQNLIVVSAHNSCCKRYACVCKTIAQCPICPTPICCDEQVIHEVTDVDDCCVVKRICICPKNCIIGPPPICKPYQRLKKIKTKCSIRYRCVCDTRLCNKKICGGCMRHQTNFSPGHCCPHHICVCNTKCCPRVAIPRCRHGQKPIAVYDAHKCCIVKYICVCCKCKPPPEVCCGAYEKVVVKINFCKCKIFICICDPKTCRPPKICGKYEVLQVVKIKGQCCPRYKCCCSKKLCPTVCPRQPCDDSQVQKPVMDERHCCIIRYTCLCIPCKPCKVPICKRNEILVKKKSACGCIRYECRCNKHVCKPIPKCSIYQVLRTHHSASCCLIHVCVCKGLHFCPVVRPCKCHPEQKLVSITDPHKCCVIKYICVCPKICRIPRRPKCKPFQTIISKKTKCCNRLCCVCNKSRCPPKLQCGLFEKVKLIIVIGICCPKYCCVPIRGCIVKNKQTGKMELKKENERWTEGLCLQCACIRTDTGYTVKCFYCVCPKCKSGFKYVPIPGQCCGICVQTHCIDDSKGRRLYELHERWQDKCCIYQCTKKDKTFMIKVTRIPCRPVRFCKEGEKPRKDECNCPCCIMERCRAVSLLPSMTIGMVKVNLGNGHTCENKEEIRGLSQCVGHCKLGVRQSSEKSLEETSKDCRIKRFKRIRVVLTCDNGKQTLEIIKVPLTCECREVCDCENL